MKDHACRPSSGLTGTFYSQPNSCKDQIAVNLSDHDNRSFIKKSRLGSCLRSVCLRFWKRSRPSPYGLRIPGTLRVKTRTCGQQSPLSGTSAQRKTSQQTRFWKSLPGPLVRFMPGVREKNTESHRSE